MTAPEQAWPAGRSLALGFVTLGLLVAGGGAWSSLTTIAGATLAPGRIEVSQSRQVVQHPDGGVVAAILVKEGSFVAAGDVVLRMDGSALRAEFAIAEAQLMELAARRARLEAQHDGLAEVAFPEHLIAAAGTRREVAELLGREVGLFKRNANALIQAKALRKTRIAQIESEIAGLRAREVAVETEMALLEVELRSLRALLERGFMQSTRVSERERDLARMAGLRGELASARIAAAGRIVEIEIEIASLFAQSDEKTETDLHDIVSRELELTERTRALADRITRLDVLAPASGIVLGLAVTTPQFVIRPAEVLMDIVPQDRPLLAAVRVPATHVDEVQVGQSVRLLFSGLPARQTPEVTGTVTLVSADALDDERTGTSFYRAEIAIEGHALQDVAGVKIVPGMPVSAFLRTKDRTPLSYLLKPFTDYFRDAFRES